jgi:hypothetical protein
LLGHLKIAPTLAGAIEAVELDALPTQDRPLLAAAIRLGVRCARYRASQALRQRVRAEGWCREHQLAAFAERDGPGLTAIGKAVRLALANRRRTSETFL